jgi:carbon monoxide dehydrogenase subunit G
MKFTGTNTIGAPVGQVWDALLDPAVLVRTIPGCERLEETGENSYAMTVTAGVAAIKGTYSGSCALSDLQPHRSLVMKLDGAGAPGTIGATVNVSFAAADGGTSVSYDADAVVGGMIGGVGQRMLASVSKRMAGEFFANVERAVLAPASAAAAVEVESEPGMPKVYVDTAAAPGRVSSQSDFVKGIAVGAGLVLAGVVAGALFGRRR